MEENVNEMRHGLSLIKSGNRKKFAHKIPKMDGDTPKWMDGKWHLTWQGMIYQVLIGSNL